MNVGARECAGFPKHDWQTACARMQARIGETRTCAVRGPDRCERQQYPLAKMRLEGQVQVLPSAEISALESDGTPAHFPVRASHLVQDEIVIDMVDLRLIVPRQNRSNCVRVVRRL